MLLDSHPGYESLVVVPDYPRYRDLAHRTRTGRAAAVTLADDEPVKAVMVFAEEHDVAKHIPRATTAAVAIDLLTQVSAKGVRPAALIISHSGRASETPLAVVVDSDLPDLLAALSLG